jgi:iron-sulfur cluster repair protein YtfE (RIC family)
MAMGKPTGTQRPEQDILTTLTDEHEQLALLMEEVMDAEATDPQARRELYGDIRTKLLVHAKAEEAEFYPICQHHAETRVLAHQATEDHDDVEQLLAELDAIPIDAPAWLETFDTLKSNVELHVDLEENELFPKLRKVVQVEELRSINEQYLARKAALEERADELEPEVEEEPEVRPEA